MDRRSCVSRIHVVWFQPSPVCGESARENWVEVVHSAGAGKEGDHRPTCLVPILKEAKQLLMAAE